MKIHIYRLPDASYSVWFYSGLLLFRLCLDFAYVGFVNPVYEGSFLSFKYDFDTRQYLLSWVAFLPSFFVLSYRLRKASNFYFLSAVLSMLIPLSSVYGLDQNMPIFPVLVTLGSIFVIYAICEWRFVKLPHLPVVRRCWGLTVYMSWIVVLLVIAWYVYSGVLYNTNLDFARVYEFREDNSRLIDIIC